jgi:hypothetical protein
MRNFHRCKYPDTEVSLSVTEDGRSRHSLDYGENIDVSITHVRTNNEGKR